MASQLMTNSQVQEIVLSDLSISQLEIYIDAADAEIIRIAGPHRLTDAGNLALRRKALVELVRSNSLNGVERAQVRNEAIWSLIEFPHEQPLQTI